ncbi:hypothetical protein HDU67_005414, partial [Dinochytrium kinnereticum]
MAVASRFVRKDGGRYTFEPPVSPEWISLDVLERRQSGIPFWSFMSLFWLEVPLSRSETVWKDNRMVTPFSSPSGHPGSLMLAEAAQKRWLEYHASIKPPMVRRHFVPLLQMSPGIHRVGGGGMICTYEIEDRLIDSLGHGDAFLIANAIPKRFVRIVRISANLRWILSGLTEGGVSTLLEPTADSIEAD